MEITPKFRERELLLLSYTTDEEMKNTIYHAMLRDDIREFVSFSGSKTLTDTIEKALEREIKLELLTSGSQSRCRQ